MTAEKFINDLNIEAIKNEQMNDQGKTKEIVPSSLDGDPNLGECAFHIGVIISQMWSSKFSSLRLRFFQEHFQEFIMFKCATAKLGTYDKYELGQHHDAGNFLYEIIDRMHEDLRRPLKELPPIYSTSGVTTESTDEFVVRLTNNWEMLQGKEKEIKSTSIIRYLFYSQTLTTQRCEKCKEYLRFEPGYPDNFIRIHLTSNIKKCNLQYLMGITWNGPLYYDQTPDNNCYHQELKNTETQNWFWRYPPILVIRLERIEYDTEKLKTIPGYDGHKDDRQVEIPLILNLNAFVHKDVVREKDANYQLYALLHHQGENIKAGHNYAFLRYNIDKKNEHWRKCDDQRVTRLDKKNGEKEACTSKEAMRNAYLIFYELKE